jgi:hypothetical protein
MALVGNRSGIPATFHSASRMTVASSRNKPARKSSACARPLRSGEEPRRAAPGERGDNCKPQGQLIPPLIPRPIRTPRQRHRRRPSPHHRRRPFPCHRRPSPHHHHPSPHHHPSRGPQHRRSPPGRPRRSRSWRRTRCPRGCWGCRPDWSPNTPEGDHCNWPARSDRRHTGPPRDRGHRRRTDIARSISR